MLHEGVMAVRDVSTGHQIAIREPNREALEKRDRARLGRSICRHNPR